MQPEREHGACEHEAYEALGAQAAEEEIEGEAEKERYHDGAEADAGEVDRPEGNGGQVGGDERYGSLLPDFFGEQIYAENGNRSENHGPEFERENAYAEYLERERLEVDKETFPTLIVFVEQPEVIRFERIESIGRIDGFIRIDARRDIFDIIRSQEERDDENGRETGEAYKSYEVFVFRVHIFF